MYQSINKVKHECMRLEDINSGGEMNPSNTAKYPSFIEEDVEYKYSELPQFWSHAQFTNEMHAKNEIHDQHNLLQAEVCFIIIKKNGKYSITWFNGVCDFIEISRNRLILSEISYVVKLIKYLTHNLIERIKHFRKLIH